MTVMTSPALRVATLPRIPDWATAIRLPATIGDTPLLPLRRVSAHLPPGVEVWAKAEWFNLSGSVKARPAWFILQAALRQGALPSRRLIDATSGNTGIAYATLGATLGVSVTLVLSTKASPERIALLRALGAEVRILDAEGGPDALRAEVERLVAAHPERYHDARQHFTPFNWLAHYLTTGPEIWRQTEGRVTHFVAGVGTGGTLMGVGAYLRQRCPGVQVVAVQPDRGEHHIEGLRHLPSVKRFGFYRPGFEDEVEWVSTSEAEAMALRLAREEGLFVGVSSGAAVAAALRVASKIERGVVVTVLPDGGEKYLSRPFWGEA